MKKNTRRMCIATATLLVGGSLLGCAATGNMALRKESRASVGQKIARGVTSKADVESLFGAPASTTFTDGGSEIWKYDLTDLRWDPQNLLPVVNWLGSSQSGIRKELVVVFDDTGIVKQFAMNESPVAVKTGIFNY